MHVVGLEGRTVALAGVWPQPAQQGPLLDQAQDHDGHVRRLLLAT